MEEIETPVIVLFCVFIYAVIIFSIVVINIQNINANDKYKLYVSYPQHCGIKYRFVVEIVNNPESNLYVLEDGTWFETKPINLNGGMQCIDVYYQYNSSARKEGVKE